MKIINKPRGAGKSTLMIEMANTLDIPIITRSTSMKKCLELKAMELGYNITVYTEKEWMYINHYKDSFVLVDECEDMMKNALEKQLGATIIAGTLSV